ncbi:MAG: class I SAM-dependent methyltransferase [Synechococcus sp.]
MPVVDSVSSAVPAPLQPTPAAPHVEEMRFADFASFEAFLQRSHQLWPQQVQQALRLIALHGILDPITREPVPAQELELLGTNFRETLRHRDCLARHRAVLLLLMELLAAGQLPPREQLELYCPEAITPFAALLRDVFPKATGSEFLPDPQDPQRQLYNHQDLCDLTLTDACMDVVLCNELFEHLYNIPAALLEIARILRPGGYLLSTFPFAYNRPDTIVKARHRPVATLGVAAEVELLMEPEFHGNPVRPEQGSLVYQIPAWDLLDQARQAGLSDPAMHWIAAPSYGVVGQEIPAVLVLVARKD